MNNLKGMWTNRDLRKRLMVLIIGLLIYKVGMHIPVPWINGDVLKMMMAGNQTGAMSVINTFTGGALSTFSIFAIGIMPYITASIVIQLLQMDVVPILVEWKNQGEMGRQKIKKATYGLTLVLAIIQSIGMSFGFNKMYPGLLVHTDVAHYLMIAGILTLGTVILVIVGEWIERKGVGKGISVLILAGILATLPTNLAQYYDVEFTNVGDQLFVTVLKTVLLVLFAIGLMVLVIIVNGGERRIPIQYSSKNGVNKGAMIQQKSFLPVKLNPAGVTPVIFASALTTLPLTIANFYAGTPFGTFVNTYLTYTSPTGMVLYGLLIVAFTFFYAFIVMDPEQISKNLHMSGGFILGRRPGNDTRDYFKSILKKLTVVGAIFLAVISMAPMLLGMAITLPQQLMLGGTSLIIMVSVAVETWGQIASYLTTNNYSNRGLFGQKETASNRAKRRAQ